MKRIILLCSIILCFCAGCGFETVINTETETNSSIMYVEDESDILVNDANDTDALQLNKIDKKDSGIVFMQIDINGIDEDNIRIVSNDGQIKTIKELKVVGCYEKSNNSIILMLDSGTEWNAVLPNNKKLNVVISGSQTEEIIDESVNQDIDASENIVDSPYVLNEKQINQMTKNDVIQYTSYGYIMRIIYLTVPYKHEFKEIHNDFIMDKISDILGPNVSVKGYTKNENSIEIEIRINGAYSSEEATQIVDLKKDKINKEWRKLFEDCTS